MRRKPALPRTVGAKKSAPTGKSRMRARKCAEINALGNIAPEKRKTAPTVRPRFCRCGDILFSKRGAARPSRGCTVTEVIF